MNTTTCARPAITILLCLACWGLPALTGKAANNPALIACESFDYAPGPVIGRNGGIGWSDAWSGVSNNLVQAPGLAYSAWTDALDVAGSAFMLNRLESSAQSFRSLSTPLGGTTGQLYVSFIAQMTNGTYAGVSCYSGGTERFFMGNPYLQSRWGVDLAPGSGSGVRASAHSAALQALLVYRLDFGATNVLVRLYINPPLNAEPAFPDLEAVRAGTFTFDRIRVAGGQSAGLFDELRLGTNYAAVVPHRPMPQSLPTFYQWWPKFSGTTTSLRGIAHSGSRYLAVGESQHVVSWNGHSWAPLDNPEFTVYSHKRRSMMRDVAYGDGWFVAVGTVYQEWGEAFASPDGENWGKRGIDSTEPLPSVTYAAGRFVCVWPARLSSPTQPEVTLWKDVYRQSTSDPHLLHDVSYDSELNRFVAVGDCGQVLWSSSGDEGTWIRRLAATEYRSENFIAVAAGRRHLVALDNQGQIHIKPEGQDWRIAAKPTSEVLNAVAFGEGVFVAVGDRGAMAISSDGYRWFPMHSGVTNKLNNIAYLGGSFFAVGDQGVILQSAPPSTSKPGLFMSSKRLTSGDFNLHYFAPPGNYRLEASTNLINWTAAQDFSTTQALTEMTDTNAASLPHRFYRAYARP